MKNETNYIKETQRDYSLSFEREVVYEIEPGLKTPPSAQHIYEEYNPALR